MATDTFSRAGFLQLFFYLTVPAGLVLLIPAGKRNSWQPWDLVIILFLWLPFDARLLNAIWLWPGSQGAYPVNTLLALCLAFFLYRSHRRLKGVGVPFRYRGKRDLLDLLLLFSLMCLVVIPVGITTGFIEFSVKEQVWRWAFGFPAILLFIALPEEFLFRALMLNYFRSRFPKVPVVIWLLLTSFIFGLSHLNNPPLYDWRYLLLSTVGGVFYGLAYLKSNNLFLPVVLHTLVDFVWINLFSGGQ